MTSWPCSASSAAATDESTPPDIATTIRIVQKPRRRHEHTKDLKDTKYTPFFFVLFVRSCCSWCRRSCGSRLSGQAAELLDEPRQHFDHAVHFLFRRKHPEAEAQRALRPVRRQP